MTSSLLVEFVKSAERVRLKGFSDAINNAPNCTQHYQEALRSYYQKGYSQGEESLIQYRVKDFWDTPF